jgi:mannosyltransferase
MAMISNPPKDFVRRRTIHVALPSRATIALLLILILASVLRFHHLDAGLWLDEIIADVEFVRAPYSTIVTTYESENQHFLYNILAHASYDLFGPSGWALRLPAVSFGLASILALYLFARQVTSATESLLATGLMTFSYHHVWFSQNARGYTGLLFWTLLSSWLLLRALRSGQRKQWLLYAASLALGLYTHFTMVFPIVGQLAAYGFELIRRRQAGQRLDWRGLFLGFGVGALLTLGLYAPVLPEILQGMGRETSLVAEWRSPLWTLAEIARGLRVGFFGGLAAVAALAVFGIGTVAYARSKPTVVILLVVPVLTCVAAVVGLGHHLWPRFFFFALGFGALVTVRGATVAGRLVGQRLFRWPEMRSDWLGTAAGLGLVLVSALSLPFVYGPKQDYEGALRFVQTTRAPGDAVATADLAAFVYDRYFRVDWHVVESVGELDALRSGAGRTWFVYTFPQVLESAAPDITASLARDFQLVKTFDGTLSGGTIYVARDN